jgi:hypothetical protein
VAWHSDIGIEFGKSLQLGGVRLQDLGGANASSGDSLSFSRSSGRNA